MTENFNSIISYLENACRIEWEKGGGSNLYWQFKGRLETAKQLKEIVEKAIDDLEDKIYTYSAEDGARKDILKELRKALGVKI